VPLELQDQRKAWPQCSQRALKLGSFL